MTRLPDTQPPAAPTLAPLPEFTNQTSVTLTGTTEARATITITGAAASATGQASAQGSFSVAVQLNQNALNTLQVAATDTANNKGPATTVSTTHDAVVPTVVITSPGQNSVTALSSGFEVAVAFADAFGTIDRSTFELTGDRDVGGVFLRTGAFSTTVAAGANLGPLFGNVTETGATLTVPDSAAFLTGANNLTARIADRAGNASADAQVSFTVTGAPDRFLVVNASAAPGTTGNAITIGLFNADSLGGVQFDFQFDPAVIASVDSAVVGDRTTTFDGASSNLVMPGLVRVLLFDTGGDRLPPGQGAILRLFVSVAAGAVPGSHSVVLTSALISDVAGTTAATSPDTGTFTVQ